MLLAEDEAQGVWYMYYFAWAVKHGQIVMSLGFMRSAKFKSNVTLPMHQAITVSAITWTLTLQANENGLIIIQTQTFHSYEKKIV